MHALTRYLKFYLGCETNKGKLIGVRSDLLFIMPAKMSSIENYRMDSVGIDVFLYLRQLSDLTDLERSDLIRRGFNIGRPSGYSFSPHAFILLLDLYVDLFGLIESGLAKNILTINPEQHKS